MNILRKLSGAFGPLGRASQPVVPWGTGSFKDDWRETKHSCDGFPGGDALKSQAQARRRDDERKVLRDMGLRER